MEKFEFNVKVMAVNKARAKELLMAMFDIKKVLSEGDLMQLAQLLKKKPGLIKKAKRFL